MRNHAAAGIILTGAEMQIGDCGRSAAAFVIVALGAGAFGAFVTVAMLAAQR